MTGRWIARTGTAASGFRYADWNGREVRNRRTLTRIERLRVPPAWRDVHIAASATRSIQAWGFDARGRKQYRYHASAVGTRERRKYYRVRQLAKALPRVRRTLRAQSRRRELTRETVSAIALRLIGESLFRPGSERYVRENRSYGITTMRKRHVRVEGDRAVFTYVGKSGKRQRQVVANAELAGLITRLLRTPGTRLFRYREGGAWCDLTSRSLIAHVRRHVGPFAVKDFRTWGATLRAATVLAEIGPGRTETEARRNLAIAMRLVASELGNTPAICRSSYVHPFILAKYVDDGATILARSAALRSSDAFAHSPEERALIAFLDKHFPERRRHARLGMARAA